LADRRHVPVTVTSPVQPHNSPSWWPRPEPLAASANIFNQQQAAIVAIDQACRRLRLPTIRAVLDEVTAAANREQLSYQGLVAGRV
jgi:hypothetical protein